MLLNCVTVNESIVHLCKDLTLDIFFYFNFVQASEVVLSSA